MKSKNNRLQQIKKYFSRLSLTEKLLHLAPVAIWFSYFPNLRIGRGEGTNFELSITLIFALIFALVGLFENWKSWRKIFKNRAVQITGIFILWNFISVIWAENPVRGFLVSGVWLVLWLDFVVILSLKNLQKISKNLLKIFFVATSIMSVLAILQVTIGAFSDFGLCAGCLARGFGFVRPSVFTIEPQFFGNLLLAPILLIWLKFLSAKKLSKLEFSTLILALIAIYLTLSRGAIFALIPAMIFAIFLIPKNKFTIWRRFLAFFVIVGGSFFIGLNIHAIFTQLNPRISDGYYEAVSKSVNQLSLGKISLPKKTEKPLPQTQISPDNQLSKTEQSAPKKAVFDGYVQKSTDERTKLTDLALKTWRKDFRTVFLGVGAGSAGRAIYRYTHETGWEFEIVQNEFVAILLELGVIGFLIWVGIIIGFIFSNFKNKQFFVVSASLMVVYLLQWAFFSGLPNALHIFLILAIIFAEFSAHKN